MKNKITKYPQIKRVRYNQDEYTPFLLKIWQFFAGIFLWIFFIVIAGITIYSHWFSQALIYILQLFKNQNYHVPLWFSIVCTIFLFPVTLIVILISAFIRIIRN
jgi:polyferredoxin